MDISLKIAEELGIKKTQVDAAVGLIDEGRKHHILLQSMSRESLPMNSELRLKLQKNSLLLKISTDLTSRRKRPEHLQLRQEDLNLSLISSRLRMLHHLLKMKLQNMSQAS